MTATGISKGHYLQSSLQTQFLDTSIIGEIGYIQRSAGITYIGQVTSGGPYNAITYNSTNCNVNSRLAVAGDVYATNVRATNDVYATNVHAATGYIDVRTAYVYETFGNIIHAYNDIYAATGNVPLQGVHSPHY